MFTRLHRCPNQTYLLLHMEEEETKVEELEPSDDKKGTHSLELKFRSSFIFRCFNKKRRRGNYEILRHY